MPVRVRITRKRADGLVIPEVIIENHRPGIFHPPIFGDSIVIVIHPPEELVYHDLLERFGEAIQPPTAVITLVIRIPTRPLFGALPLGGRRYLPYQVIGIAFLAELRAKHPPAVPHIGIVQIQALRIRTRADLISGDGLNPEPPPFRGARVLNIKQLSREGTYHRRGEIDDIYPLFLRQLPHLGLGEVKRNRGFRFRLRVPPDFRIGVGVNQGVQEPGIKQLVSPVLLKYRVVHQPRLDPGGLGIHPTHRLERKGLGVGEKRPDKRRQRPLSRLERLVGDGFTPPIKLGAEGLGVVAGE